MRLNVHFCPTGAKNIALDLVKGRTMLNLSVRIGLSGIWLWMGLVPAAITYHSHFSQGYRGMGRDLYRMCGWW